MSSFGGGTVIGAWILIATFIQGIGCVYFTQGDQNLALPYSTPNKTAITRIFSILEYDETKQHLSVEKITKQGDDSLILGPYFTVDGDGWVRLNKPLTMNLVGTVFTVTLSASALDKPSSAPTRVQIHIQIIQEYDCDVDRMCFQTPGAELLFSFQETETEGHTEVAWLKESNIAPKCGVVALQYSLRETGQSTRFPGIVSISNTTSALVIKRPLDRETIKNITADVTCDVRSSRRTVKRKLKIQVLDVDDEEPYILWRDIVSKKDIRGKNKTYEFEWDEVCDEGLGIVIEDKDLGPDNYTARIEGDYRDAFTMGPVTIIPGSLQFIQATMQCKRKVVNRGMYEVNVIFTDTSLISKHKNNEARYTVRVNTGEKPLDLCSTTQQNTASPITNYKIANADKVTVNTSAGHYYRVKGQFLFLFSVIYIGMGVSW